MKNRIMPAMASLTPVAPLRVTCKCCGGEASIFGLVDFNRNCETPRIDPLSPCGIPVYYHRCGRCGFIFTTAFDHFTPDDFRRLIYNEQYALADPDYRDIRPARSAEFVARTFPLAKGKRVLDYGGGNGRMADLLRADGFADVTVYDPFVPAFSTPPAGTFALISCFEVVEHSPDPRGTFAQLASRLDPDGLIVYSTLVQPPDILKLGVGWWYLAPRNGHVSLFTRPALAAVATPLGLKCASFDDGIHTMFRRLPDFAKHLMPQ